MLLGLKIAFRQPMHFSVAALLHLAWMLLRTYPGIFGAYPDMPGCHTRH